MFWPGIVPESGTHVDEGEGDEEQRDHGEAKGSLPPHSLNKIVQSIQRINAVPVPV